MTDIKHIKGIQRQAAMEHERTYGPGHGRAGEHRTTKDKARCSKHQRRNWRKELD